MTPKTEPVADQDPAPDRRDRFWQRRWIMPVTATVAVMVTGGVGLSVFLRDGHGSPSRAEVQRVHDVLHDVDALCPAGIVATGGARSRLERDTDTVVTFARRYPDASFPIDDETGRSLTLLMVTRQGLLTCLPEAAARIDAALPTEYRNSATARP